MGFQFLSDEWFDKVKEIREAAGDLGLSDVAKAIVMNIRVTSDEGDTEMCLNGGEMEKGRNDSAPVTINVPYDIARKMFVDNDQSAGTQAYMSGKLKIEGDMSKLMAAGSIQPTPAQQELSKKIQEMTE